MASPAGNLPRQGDHVFNDVATVSMRPFDLIDSIGRGARPTQFRIRDFMPLALADIARIWQDSRYIAGRTYTSDPGWEPGVLRVLEPEKSRFPSFHRMSAAVFQQSHQHNSTEFGEAAHEFEVQVLRLILNALTVAVQHPGRMVPIHLLMGAAAPIQSHPQMAAQRLIGAAFDPAAALVYLVHNANLEGAAVRGAAIRLASEIAATIEPLCPAQWRGVMQGQRLPPNTDTGRAAAAMAAMWTFFLEVQEIRMRNVFLRAVNEITAPVKGRLTDAEWQHAYAEAIAGIHETLQRIASRVP